MTKDEALKMALKAFEWNYNTDLDNIPACEKWAKMLKENIAAIKEALMSVPDGAQTEPWEKFCDSNCVWTDHHPDCKLAQRKPLTDEEIRKANHHMVDGAYDYSFKQGVKWAEYKHGIKENT